jgi:hypothetical protein
LFNGFEVIAISNYLEDHEISDGVYEQEALDFVKIIIESLDEDNFTFDELVQLRNNLNKVCQANQIVSFVSNTDSPIVNFVPLVFSRNDEYNLAFEDVDIPSDLQANANTILPLGLDFNSSITGGAIIQFDNNYLDNATDLSIVMTAAHEFVHVYLAYLYSEGQLLIAYPEYTDLNTAFSAYQNDSSAENGGLLGDAMHYVYDDFLDWITQSVFTYATNNNIEGATEEYCNKLVIGSHENTDAFQNLNTTNQNAYSIIAINEQDGTAPAKGTKCD